MVHASKVGIRSIPEIPDAVAEQYGLTFKIGPIPETPETASEAFGLYLENRIARINSLLGAAATINSYAQAAVLPDGAQLLSTLEQYLSEVFEGLNGDYKVFHGEPLPVTQDTSTAVAENPSQGTSVPPSVYGNFDRFELDARRTRLWVVALRENSQGQPYETLLPAVALVH